MLLTESYKTILRKLIREAIVAEPETKEILIIPKGTELFYGTENKNFISELKNYSGKLWVQEDSAIAQASIPTSDYETALKTSMIVEPSLSETIQQIQKQLGIEYYNIETKGNQISSYRMAPIFKEISDKKYNAWNNYYKNRQITDLYKKAIENREYKTTDELTKKYLEFERITEKYNKEYASINEKEVKNEIVNNKLKSLGYTPDVEGSYDKDYRWELKMAKEGDIYKIVGPNYRQKGSLVILTPKVDLKIFNFAKSDRDYYEYGIMEKIKNKGFDGIKTSDQSNLETMGEFRHPSIALFNTAIPKLNAIQIEAENPRDFFEKHYHTSDYRSDEYKKYKGANS